MTLYESVSVLSCASFIFGVFSINKRAKISNFITFIYIGLFTSCLISIIVQKTSSLRQIVSGDYYKSNLVSNFGLLFHFISGGTAFYTIAIGSLWKSGDVRKTLRVMHKIDETLKKFGQKFQHRRDKIFTTTIYFSGVITILSIFMLQSTNIDRENLKGLGVNMWFGLIFPLIISNIMTTQFSCTVLAIYDRMKKVNEQLKKLEKFDEKHKNLVLNKIKILMKLYDSLFDVAKQTNNNYMVQLFITLNNQYGVVLFSIFYFYWMVIEQKVITKHFFNNSLITDKHKTILVNLLGMLGII